LGRRGGEWRSKFLAEKQVSARLQCRRIDLTALLTKAFDAAQKLDQAEREALARWLLDELPPSAAGTNSSTAHRINSKASLPKLLPNAVPAVHSHWIRTACERADHAVLS